MKEENEKGVFSLKFSVFSDGGVPSVDGVDFELICVPGFGRPWDFRMEDGTTKYANHANEEAWRFEVIRVPGFGSHRKVTEGIGRLENFQIVRFSNYQTESRKMAISNFEWRNRKADEGSRRWMSLDDGEKFFIGRLSVSASRSPRSVVVGRNNFFRNGVRGRESSASCSGAAVVRFDRELRGANGSYRELTGDHFFNPTMSVRLNAPENRSLQRSAVLRARFDVDEDVADGGEGFADFVFDVVGDLVAALDGHEGIDLDVHVDVVTVADLADYAFLDVLRAGDAGGEVADAVDDILAGGAIHEFVEGGAKQMPAVPGNDTGGDDGGDVVGGFVAFAADEGNGNADGGAKRGDGVAAMMPGIGMDSGAVDGFGFLGNEAIEALLDDYDDDQYHQRKGFGRLALAGEEFAGRIEGDSSGSQQQHGGDDGGGNGLGLAVTVGMIFIGWNLSDHHCAPDHDGAEDIGERFDGIGNERVRMPDEAGSEFSGCEQGVENHAEPGCAETAIEAFRCHEEM
jgi:hypothetical protein